MDQPAEIGKSLPLSEFQNLITRLADAAGSIARQYFRNNPHSEYKEDATPVTLADREIEKAIRDILETERPNDGIWGEEFGVKLSRNGLKWVIDPIDGTKAFMTGKPLFATLIALLENDKPVLSVIDQPIAKERWTGVKDQPSRFNGQPVKTRDITGLGNAIIATTGPSYFDQAANDAYENLRKQAKFCVWGGDAYNYGLLASGYLDLVVEKGLKLHDYAALVPVIEGAGGIITDWHGKPLTGMSDGSVIAAAGKELHGQALAFLQKKAE